MALSTRVPTPSPGTACSSSVWGAIQHNPNDDIGIISSNSLALRDNTTEWTNTLIPNSMILNCLGCGMETGGSLNKPQLQNGIRTQRHHQRLSIPFSS